MALGTRMSVLTNRENWKGLWESLGHTIQTSHCFDGFGRISGWD